MANLLIIAVHPDDETLGCGGTILKHIEMGDNVYWMILTDGNNQQKKQINTIADKYRFKDTFPLGFKDLALDDLSLNKIIPSIETLFQKIKPEILYIPFNKDPNSDHRRAFQAIWPCTKNFRHPYIKKIMMYEVISETDFAPSINDSCFIPNIFNDISAYFERKLEIMKLYQSELMPEPYPRSLSSIKAHDRYRGSRIGAEYAEAFQLLIQIL